MLDFKRIFSLSIHVVAVVGRNASAFFDKSGNTGQNVFDVLLSKTVQSQIRQRHFRLKIEIIVLLLQLLL